MDIFFEAGNIVSNADTARLAAPGLPSSSYGLAEALKGGAEYFVQIALDYGAAEERSRPSPHRASYRICTTGERRSSRAKRKTWLPQETEKDERNAHEIARILIGRMEKDR
jgi:hypothetical protein